MFPFGSKSAFYFVNLLYVDCQIMPFNLCKHSQYLYFFSLFVLNGSNCKEMCMNIYFVVILLILLQIIFLFCYI